MHLNISQLVIKVYYANTILVNYWRFSAIATLKEVRPVWVLFIEQRFLFWRKLPWVITPQAKYIAMVKGN